MMEEEAAGENDESPRGERKGSGLSIATPDIYG